MQIRTRTTRTAVLAGGLVAAVALTAACTDDSAAATEATGAPVADAVATDDAAPTPTTAEIAALFDDWNAALATGDPATVAARYAPGAVLLPTVSNEVRDTPESIEAYFVDFLEASPQGTIDSSTVRVLDDGTAKDVGVYTFALTDADGNVSDVQARYTFVYELVDGEWLIAHHHSSAMPEA